MVRCGSKNGHQKDMCFKEIGWRAKNILIIPASIVNMIGGRKVAGHIPARISYVPSWDAETIFL
jgi:hypothetical protein